MRQSTQSERKNTTGAPKNCSLHTQDLIEVANEVQMVVKGVFFIIIMF